LEKTARKASLSTTTSFGCVSPMTGAGFAGSTAVNRPTGEGPDRDVEAGGVNGTWLGDEAGSDVSSGTGTAASFGAGAGGKSDW
jgi:hypothetical protein